MIIGNAAFTCDNSCVFTTDPNTGVTNIEDCCGGRVTMTILPDVESLTIGDFCP